MAGGPEDHFTDSRELYVLVEGDEWAHVEALDPDAGYWARRFAQLVNWRARGEKAVIEPSSLQRRNSQLKEIARLRAEGALTESEFEAVKARLLSDEASAYRKKLPAKRNRYRRSPAMPVMCIHCRTTEAPQPLGYCPSCAANARSELVEGLNRLGEYLSSWAAFDDWLRRRGLR